MDLDRLFKKVVAGVLVVELLEDKSIIEDRVSVCEPCLFRDKDKNKCTVCKCYLDVKTASKINRNIKTGKSEITHCPQNKWVDHFSKFGYDKFKTES